MIAQTDLSGALALDTKGLGALRQSAKAKSPEALKGAATQFEAMFINMMMKSMRDATPQDGIMDNQQTKMFTSMLDQQLSQNLAKRGVGLADVLVRQLSTQAQALAIGADQPAQPSGASLPAGAAALAPGLSPTPPTTPSATPSAAPLNRATLVPASGDNGVRTGNQSSHVRAFQDKMAGFADDASRATGIPAKFMLGQAALESGWGRHEIKNADGSASHNLFGIKAGPGWKGKVVNAVTTEYVNGVPQTRVEKFRAYDSYADSFKDYANMLSTNPRYEKVLASAQDATGFAHGLQKAGYATDPFYASKLTRIIQHNLA